MPKHYTPGLVSHAFHQLPAVAASERWGEAQAAVLNAAVVYLESETVVAGLVQELSELRAAGEMRVEQECIHEAGGGRGQWKRYDPTEVGHRFLVDDGTGGRCTKHTAPVACGVLTALREAWLPAIRGSYSEIGAGGVLRSHYGMTNGQLKFHLGLVVPGSGTDGAECAAFRVGAETRRGAWEEGRVIFFDDSWSHEVVNGCQQLRAVFQVVFLHPELWEEAGGDWRAAAGFVQQPRRAG